MESDRLLLIGSISVNESHLEQGSTLWKLRVRYLLLKSLPVSREYIPNRPRSAVGYHSVSFKLTEKLTGPSRRSILLLKQCLWNSWVRRAIRIGVFRKKSQLTMEKGKEHFRLKWSITNFQFLTVLYLIFVVSDFYRRPATEKNANA